MHYYKRNLGDYAKKAGRLTMLQHGAYTLLIDSCYDREIFPTLEQALEWTWASTEAEVEAVKFVLNRFFTQTNGGVYIQERVQEELDTYHQNAETNKRIAIEREAKRRANTTNREQSVNEPTPNHKPRTINHKPVTNINTPDGVSDSVFKDYLEVRKAKKAKWTDTALKGLQREAAKANMTLQEVMVMCCERSWVGFKAEWAKTEDKSKELPLGTDQQIAHAYKVECGGDPTQSRFGSYFEMRKYVLDQRDKRKSA